MIVDTEQPDENEQHKAGFPCPVCDVITIRQPWASLIALGMKHYEFRSSNFPPSGCGRHSCKQELVHARIA